MIATYAKVPTKTGPGLTKVMLDGAKKDDGTIFVPAWLHAFFLQHGMKDSLIPRIQELKNDHRAQLVLAGAHLLSGRISSLERQAYEAFIDKTRGATTSK